MSNIGLYPVPQYPVSGTPGTPPRSRKISTPTAPRKSYPHRKSLFDEPDLSHKLEECGLTINRQILSKDRDGSVTSPYAKVQSEDGNEMLILLDIPGRLPLDENENPMVMKEEPSDENLPPLLDQDVIGISYVCEGNVCIKLGERTQHLGEISNDGLTQVYPVVKMSSLVENPTRVTNSAKIASMKLKEQSLINAQSQLKALGSNLSALSQEYNTFLSKQREAANRLMGSISQLEQIKTMYNSMRELSPVDQQKYDLVLSGLKTRNKLLSELSLIDQKIGKVNKEIVENIEKLNELNNFIATQFSSLDRV
jgi:hypothetical protein